MRVAIAAAAALALGAIAHPGRADDATPCGVPAVPTAPVHAGWRVQVDPETGTYGVPPPESAAAPATAGARAADVVVMPGTTAAGGYKLRLDDAAATTMEQR